MEEYKPRKIEFREIIEMDGWSIKAYTISKNGSFNHPVFYSSVKKQIPTWLAMDNGFNSNHDHKGFLIVHSGTEGIFTLINWWVGENMLNTHIFITTPEDPEVFTRISGNGLAPCIWELQVICHEKNAWIENVLKRDSHPDYDAYLMDVYNDIV